MSLDATLQINVLRAEFQTPLASEAGGVGVAAQVDANGFASRLDDLQGARAPIEDSNLTTNLSDIVGEWSKGANEIKKMFDAALGGKPLSQTELLYLQASTHAVAFEFEAMGKLVETSSNAIKTTVQTQV